MYIVTGGAGFIGSHVVRELNARGIHDILVVDNLENSAKFVNLCDCQIADYMDKREFRERLETGKFDVRVETIFHQGACSNTMEYNGRYMMDNNYTYSILLLRYVLERRIPFIYASSAAVYGAGTVFVEQPEHERPLNIYGYSKLLFDQYVRRHLPDAQSTVVGLRYFNVYGSNEAHKGHMASMVYQCLVQLQETDVIKLFVGTDGYGDGEQQRDFIFVGDVVAVNLFFAEGGLRKGIYNVGTGKSRSFNDVARTLIALHGSGQIQYISFPETLAGKYQSFTQADVTALRAAGFQSPFTRLEDGIRQMYEAASKTRP
jgi:ADP-L-glycero-D-manno-heptose 6-epimerase